jgi:hypothetical protein
MQKRATSAPTSAALIFALVVILASMLSGSTLGVVISGGCSGVSDVAGRVGAVKIFNSTETPEE